jgi:hypothetical protein
MGHVYFSAAAWRQRLENFHITANVACLAIYDQFIEEKYILISIFYTNPAITRREAAAGIDLHAGRRRGRGRGRFGDRRGAGYIVWRGARLAARGKSKRDRKQQRGRPSQPIHMPTPCLKRKRVQILPAVSTLFRTA